MLDEIPRIVPLPKIARGPSTFPWQPACHPNGVAADPPARNRDCPAQAVETPQVLNENLSEAMGTAGRLSEGKPVRFPTPL